MQTRELLNMQMIDTHAHLYWDKFEEDFQEVIDRCLETGVTTLINVGVDLEKSQLAASLRSDKIELFSTIGIHPEEAINFSLNPDESIHQCMDRLEEIYRSNPSKVVAVGECGLDFLFANQPWPLPSSTPNQLPLTPDQIKDLQRKLLKAHIGLAKKLNLPLSIHCRDDRAKNPQSSECWNEVIELTKDHFGVYHCYSGLLPTTNYLLQNTNFYISFAATLTYPKNDYLREAARVIPLERIVLETDCPFLPPQSKRGQRNEPAFILETAQALAEVKGVSLEEVARITTENTKKLFSFK